MTRKDLVSKIKKRKQKLNITIENLAKISGIGIRTLNRFFAGDDVKLSTVEKITLVLGLDFAGEEITSLKELQQHRAKEKAIFIASLVQGTSALERQGVEKNILDRMVDKFEQEFLNGQYKNRLWVS